MIIAIIALFFCALLFYIGEQKQDAIFPGAAKTFLFVVVVAFFIWAWFNT